MLAREAARREIWVILDFCYEKLIYDAVPHNLPAVLDRYCRDFSVICGSASKAYAMTGWRCGWSIGPAAVIAAEHALQSHATSNVSSITQKAVVAALTGSQAPVGEMLDEYRKRRDSLHEWLTADARIRCLKPAGAFYLFVDIGSVLSVDGIRTSAEFAQALLDEARVAVTPGEAFDAPGFLRLSYATSMEHASRGQPAAGRVRRRARAPHGGGGMRARVRRRFLRGRERSPEVMNKIVAVIGASSNRSKFGNRAVRAFVQQGYAVVPINPHAAEIEGLKAYASVLDVPGPIDMATLYVPPEIGVASSTRSRKSRLPKSG